MYVYVVHLPNGTNGSVLRPIPESVIQKWRPWNRKYLYLAWRHSRHIISTGSRYPLTLQVRILYKEPINLRWHERKRGQRRAVTPSTSWVWHISTAKNWAASCIDGIAVRHTVIAIDAILNHTAASPLTSSTGATASVAKCAMCVCDHMALATKRPKTMLTKWSRGVWSVAYPLARNIVRQV